MRHKTILKKLDARIDNARRQQKFQVTKFQPYRYIATTPTQQLSPIALISLLLLITIRPTLTTKVLEQNCTDLNNHLSLPPTFTTNSTLTTNNNIPEYDNATHLSQQMMTTHLIMTKLKYDPSISNKKQPYLKKKCKKVVAMLTEAVEHQQHHNHITATLKQEKFAALICTTRQRMLKLQSNTLNDIKGVFMPNYNSVLISADSYGISTEVVSHEFFHADNFYRHSTTQCLSNSNTAITPIYPVTEENIARLNEAFDQGDSQLKLFHQVWLADQEKAHLTDSQKSLLAKFTDLSIGCAILHDEIVIDADFYQKAAIHLAQHEALYEQLQVAGKNFGKIKINYVRQAEAKYLLGYSVTDPIQTLLLLPHRVNDKISQPVYSNKNSYVQLAEREAFTFSPLTPKAAAEIYTKAYAIRQKDVEQCTPITANRY